QLIEYAGLLREVDDALRSPMDAGDIAHWRERFATLAWAPATERLAAPMAQLLPTVRPAQVDHLRQRFEAKNRDFRREYMPTSRRSLTEARAERMTERAERFLGPLRRDQQQRVKDVAADMPSNEPAMLAERE